MEDKMSATDASTSFLSSSLQPLKNVLSDSLKILCDSPKFFISITVLTILPVSLLVFALGSLSHPLNTQISYKAALCEEGPTLFERQHVWREVRSDAASLLRLKAVFFLPSYVFSLLAAITVVSSAFSSYHGRRPSFEAALTAVRRTWQRLLITSVFVFVAKFVYSQLAQALSRFEFLACAKLFVVAGLGGFEVYLMVVLSLGMVVSVLEERFGLEALEVGWALMEGRQFCGMVLGATVVWWSGGIGWGSRILMDKKMDGGGFVGLSVKAALIGLFCLVVLWSHLCYTVLYCECKKRHGMTTGRGDSTVQLIEDTI